MHSSEVFVGAYRDFTCVDCEAYRYSRWEHSISVFDYIIILYGAMVDFADVTEIWNSVLEHAIHILRLLYNGDCFSADT